MKVNELRIGNLVNVINCAEVVITADHIKSISEGDTDYSPIPLTPEWLERCGLFENGASYKGELRFKGCGHLTIEVIENGSLGYFAPFNKTIEIKYLHQLQNLYFALTGEELNVKL